MKRIEFINKPRQLYYHFKISDVDKNSICVLILLKKPVEMFYDKDIKGIKKNIVSECFIKTHDAKLVQDIMKSNTIAVQHLRNEKDQSVADLAQLKVSYNAEIKKWNQKWKVVN